MKFNNLITFIAAVIFPFFTIGQNDLSDSFPGNGSNSEIQTLYAAVGNHNSEDDSDIIVETETSNSCTELEVVFNGISYGAVYYENRCWLDRNLGAEQIAATPKDQKSFGGYFQWGRLMDGHEENNSSMSCLLSGIDNSGLSNFTTACSEPFDWRSPGNSNLWQSGNTVNNPCPEGWRVPTVEEWELASENWENLNDAFNSPLKITAAGFRHFSDGTISSDKEVALLWTSTSVKSNSFALIIDEDKLLINENQRALGISVRCIKAGN